MGWELEKPASFFLGVVDFFSRGWSLSMPPMGGGGLGLWEGVGGYGGGCFQVEVSFKQLWEVIEVALERRWLQVPWKEL